MKNKFRGFALTGVTLNMFLLRRIVFFVFVAGYLITCPLVLLYAVGYIVNPLEEFEIEKTGAISLATWPAGATVLLNGSRYAQKTPAVIMELQPGRYQVRASKPGFRPWESTVNVSAGRAKLLEHALLLPHTMPVEYLSGKTFERLTAVEGTAYLLLRSGSRLGEYYVYDMKDAALSPLLGEDRTALGSWRVLDEYVTPKSPVVLFRVYTGEKETFLRIDLAERPEEIRNIGHLLDPRATQISWHDTDEELFFLLDRNVYRADLRRGSVYPELVRDVDGLGLFEDRIYVVDDFRVTRRHKDGASEDIILGNRALGRRLFDRKAMFHIRGFKDGILLFSGGDGSLISNRSPYLHVEDGLRGFTPDPDSRRVVVWEKRRLGILDFSAAERLNTEAFERAVTINWIYEAAHDIGKAYWVYRASHVVFSDNRTVYLLDSLRPAEDLAKPIAAARNETAFYFWEKDGGLYFIAEANDRLARVRLVQKRYGKDEPQAPEAAADAA